jgi:hypothetical protein
MAQAYTVRRTDRNPSWNVFTIPERNDDVIHVMGTRMPRRIQEKKEYNRRPAGLFREKSRGIPARRYISSIHTKNTRRGIITRRISDDLSQGWTVCLWISKPV